jgi:peptidoglycan-associated lipoprotein
MRIKQFLKITAVSMAVVALSACSHLSKNRGGADGMGGAGDGSQTYGMDSANNFGSGRDVATLDAPRDQTYYFSYDNSAPDDHDIGPIKAQANYLAEHPNAKVRLEGNTDERGSREYNIGLGYRRCQAVAQIMEQQGVSPKQIAMVSYGKERPVAMGHDEAAWELNRRVHLVYEAK